MHLNVHPFPQSSLVPSLAQKLKRFELFVAPTMQLSPAPSLASTAIASPFLFFPLFSLHLSPSLALSIYKPITLRASLHHSTIQTKMPRLLSYIFLILLFPSLLLGASPFPYGSRARFMVPSTSAGSHPPLSDSKRYEGSSDLIHLRYHMGPVLSSPINLYLIWYGPWPATLQAPLRDFLLSLSDSSPPPPSAAQWWSTVALYSDQTGANVSRRVAVAAEAHLPRLPRGSSLSRLDVQLVIADALASKALPIDHGRGAYIVLTAPGVAVQDFCRAACGFHYFTFPSLVGHTLPYAWVGHSGVQCPDVCAYPFAVPTYMTGMGAMRPPNGDVGVDGMVSVLAHEMAELATNPLVNAWYAGEDPTAPTEIADLCEGVYGSGGGGGYTGQVSKDEMGRSYNLNGRNGRKFLVQWVWSPVMQACRGPNALDY